MYETLSVAKYSNRVSVPQEANDGNMRTQRDPISLTEVLPVQYNRLSFCAG
jgi:hypothetical protein